MADGGEDGIGGVAGGSLEIAAAEMALGLHVADHGLDGGAASQLTLDCTERERALGADIQLLNFQDEMARPERFELPTPRFVVWGRPLKSLSYVTERSSVVPVPPKFSGSRSFDCYRETTVCDPH